MWILASLHINSTLKNHFWRVHVIYTTCCIFYLITRSYPLNMYIKWGNKCTFVNMKLIYNIFFQSGWVSATNKYLNNQAKTFNANFAKPLSNSWFIGGGGCLIISWNLFITPTFRVIFSVSKTWRDQFTTNLLINVMDVKKKHQKTKNKKNLVFFPIKRRGHAPLSPCIVAYVRNWLSNRHSYQTVQYIVQFKKTGWSTNYTSDLL